MLDASKTPRVSLATESMFEIYDMITLALDATAGTNHREWQINEARSYLRAAQREMTKTLELGAG